MTEPQIRISTQKKLVGNHLAMNLLEDKTRELWQSFLPKKSLIPNAIHTDLIALQVYPDTYFDHFNPSTLFEKWALIEVSDVDHVPTGMEPFILAEGLYAVFPHKGMDTHIFTYIYTEWIPNAPYQLDDRPHFEVLGAGYRQGDPNSEEEIWIPIRPTA